MNNFDNTRNTNFFVIFVILFSLLLGCQKEDHPPAKSEVNIGILLPLSGSAGSVSESSQLAATMAAQDVNRHFENTHSEFEIRTVVEDTETDPGKVLEALEKLHQQGITTVIGPYTSANAAAVLDYANTNNITLLSPASVATSLSINDHLYRLVPDNSNQSRVLAALFLHDSIEALIPVVRNDLWGNGLMENLKQEIDPSIALQNVINYDPVNPEADLIAGKIQNALDQTAGIIPPHRTGILLLTYDEGTEILGASSHLNNIAGTIWYGSSAYANNADLVDKRDAAEFAKKHTFTCSAFGPDPGSRHLWEPVRDELTIRLGHIPDVYSLNMYDAVWLMAMTWQNNLKGVNGMDFRNMLELTAQGFQGITGDLTFDGVGDRKKWSFDFWGLSLNNDAYDWKWTGYYEDGNLEINR